MTRELTYTDLAKACAPGGASVLTDVTELRPAAGPHAGIAPARYVRGSQATYAFETRYIDGQALTVVDVLSKQGAINHLEDALATAIIDGDEDLSLTPRAVVHYEGVDLYDYQAPHRIFDGHFRAGSVGSVPVTELPKYRALRDASQANARPLLETSPSSLVFGSWDSTRRSHQGRYRSAIVGEIIGVLADQSADGKSVPPRGAARFDTLAPSVRLPGKDLEGLLEAQEAELSPKNVESIRNEIKRSGKGAVSAAALGLGSIPPSLSSLGFVSCRQIIRSHVLSFSALRQLRFGSPGAGDIACRALLAALGLACLARSNEELLIRANCDLVEAESPQVGLDGREGVTVGLSPLTRETTSAVLAQAIEQARQAADVTWEGQTLEVEGNPVVYSSVVADEDGKD